MRYFIKADQYLLEHGVIEKGYLVVEDGRFSSISTEVPTGEKVIDWSGYMVAPGLFDTHIHGINGQDIMDGKEEAVKGISTTLASQGVTRFLPTTLTSSDTDLRKTLEAIKRAEDDGLPGAQSQGIFLEGPYFTEQHKGAQNEKYFRDPNIEEFQQWQEISGGNIVKIALAPEREGSLAFIRKVKGAGVQVSIAHSDATFDCCIKALENGVNNFVHLFNGMRGLHHREPGVVGAAFHSEDAFVELISDGLHVHPEVAALTYRLKADQLMLITDCMRAGGMPDGSYKLGEFPVIMEAGVARTETGSLAGSTLKLLDGIRNLQKWTKADLQDIWHLASLTPAKSLEMDNEIGSISFGKKADYVVIDSNLEVQATAVDGNLIYTKEEERGKNDANPYNESRAIK